MSDHVFDGMVATRHLAASLAWGNEIDDMAQAILRVRNREGRLFLIGNGGGAANALHAAADFRLQCKVDARVPMDNVAELTARINDRSWRTCLTGYLSNACIDGVTDALFVFSVNGGSASLSENLVDAIEYANYAGVPILGVVGQPGGYLAEVGTHVAVLDPPQALKTPLVESFQALVWHVLVTHPDLRIEE